MISNNETKQPKIIEALLKLEREKPGSLQQLEPQVMRLIRAKVTEKERGGRIPVKKLGDKLPFFVGGHLDYWEYGNASFRAEVLSLEMVDTQVKAKVSGRKYEAWMDGRMCIELEPGKLLFREIARLHGGRHGMRLSNYKYSVLTRKELTIAEGEGPMEVYLLMSKNVIPTPFSFSVADFLKPKPASPSE